MASGIQSGLADCFIWLCYFTYACAVCKGIDGGMRTNRLCECEVGLLTAWLSRFLGRRGSLLHGVDWW